MLAAVVLRQQGIAVHWISYETPFFSADKARQAARALDIPLTVKNITDVYLPMLKNPPCGYGRHMNPCLDCHSLMIRLSGEMMEELSCRFVFTGEVMGQRPMSQTKSSMRYVEKHSDIEGFLLRPLSARLLPETIPEKEGWVDRDRLGDISGRSRKAQMAMAEEYGVTEYPAPAGGCLLTEQIFSERLADLFQHQSVYTENELHLLRYGRHFRLSPTAKLIVGRTRQDNDNILKYQDCPNCAVLKVDQFPGPIAILSGRADESILMLAAGICVGYSKAPNGDPTRVLVSTGEKKKIVQMMGVPAKSIDHLLI